MVFGIASREPNNVVEQYIAQLDVTFPILVDPDGSVHGNYQQQSAFPSAAYPQDWIISPESTIIYRNNGYELDAMLSAMGIHE